MHAALKQAKLTSSCTKEKENFQMYWLRTPSYVPAIREFRSRTEQKEENILKISCFEAFLNWNNPMILTNT